MNTEATTFELGRDEALVLFDLLADFHSQPELTLNSSAERLALIRLHGTLEKAMVEPFTPEYQNLLKAARSRLSEQFG